jgi:ATP-binding cassette subfamily F protein 3
MIDLQAVTKAYGLRSIFEGLTWTVGEGARIGLVGPNGSGKSTLLRVLAGLEEIQRGQVVRRRDLRIAYLPQHVEGSPQSPVQVLLSSRPDLAALEAELAACEARLGSPEVAADLTRMERLLAQQERIMRRIEELGGSGFEGEARAHLLSLGIPGADITRPMAELSGGQRKLVALAACLAQRPDVLLLDEPETHLDLPHREQLEALIRAFSGGVIVVSHDRYLLDETVSEIAELADGRLSFWQGNYSAYAVAKELALQRQQELYQSQQKEIAHLEEAIARFKMWAAQVVNERHIKQARVKQRQIDQMDKIERPVLERRRMGLRLQSAERGGQKVVELTDVSVAFDDEPVILGADLTVRRGERVGVIGANGAGKSVLGRLLTGRLAPLDGRLWVGPSIRIGYFSQTQDTLPAGLTPLELVRNARPVRENEAVTILMRFLFRYDQVRQPIETLSGGEQSRLQLLLLMLDGANCLVLDEPTNHLDIDSVEVLESALEQFDGTIIVISHDRYFLDRIADRIVEVTDGSLLQFQGGYSAWRERNLDAGGPLSRGGSPAPSRDR